MAEHPSSWALIKGSGLAVEGPCILQGIILTPDVANDWIKVYDGLDATSGRLFCEMTSSFDVTWPFRFGGEPLFSTGVYIEGIDGAVQTTVIYDSLE